MEIDVSPAMALFIIEQARKDGTLPDAAIRHYETLRNNEIALVEERLAQLRGMRTSIAPAVAGPKLVIAAKRAPVEEPQAQVKQKRKMKVTPERAAQMKKQGQYISMLRRLAPSKQKKYANMCKREGRDATIKAMSAELGR